jgi:hypothetical protein
MKCDSYGLILLGQNLWQPVQRKGFCVCVNIIEDGSPHTGLVHRGAARGSIIVQSAKSPPK